MSTPIRGNGPSFRQPTVSSPPPDPATAAAGDLPPGAPLGAPEEPSSGATADEFSRADGGPGFGQLMGSSRGGAEAVVEAPQAYEAPAAGSAAAGDGSVTVEISPDTVPAGPPGSFAATSAAVASRFESVSALGEKLAQGSGPLNDEERAAWIDGQAQLRREVTELAAAVGQLPANAPERTLAQDRLRQMSERLAALELPVLARLDPQMGESFAHFLQDRTPGSEGAVLARRLELYGISEQDLVTYVQTGKEPKGLKNALDAARNRGDWAGLGVVRAAYQLRADYLRATTSPDDVASRQLAEKLDDSAAVLTRNRAEIQLRWGTDTFYALTKKYPDPSKRPAGVERRIQEAKNAIESVGARALEQVEAHPKRFGKNSPTRRLAADALRSEAGVLSSEATKVMERQAKELSDATAAQNKNLKQGETAVVPPPPDLHPDLQVGGAVDQKRAKALAVDPRLGDVVAGGDRAVAFAREVRDTRKLRLGIDEQQVAHLQTKSPGSKPPAELQARVNTQLDEIFRSTLETHDRLTAQKPGALGVEQTRLLGELDQDAVTYAGKISRVAHGRSQADAALSMARENDQLIYRGQAGIAEATKDLDKSKAARIANEMASAAGDPSKVLRVLDYQKDPAAYVAAQPDSKDEAAMRAKLGEASSKAAQLRVGTQEALAKAQGDHDHGERVNELGSLHTDADMATGLAKDALARADAHMKAIPAKGPDRLPKMQAALDHQQAVLGVSTLQRDNADARIARTTASDQAVQVAYTGVPVSMGDDPVGRSAEYLAKVTGEETAVKRAAFQDGKDAAMAADALRTSIGKELDAAQAKLPASARERQQGAVQQYKDALAVQQAGMHGRVAEMGADLEPMQAQLHLDRAAEIVEKELPYQQVARLSDQQAALDHARNEARGEALASLGEAGLAVAQRAQTQGGVAFGQLVVDSLGTAHRSAGNLRETLTIDAGGAAERTANKDKVAELRARGEAITNTALEIDQAADVEKLADVLDQELVTDVEAYNKTYSELEKGIREQRGEAFGFFMNGVSRLKGAVGLEGGDLNAMSVEDGLAYLKLASHGKLEAMSLHDVAESLRQMKRAGVPGHVIMAALRDPQLAGLTKLGEQYDPAKMERFNGWRNELAGAVSQRFGATVDKSLLAGVWELRSGGQIAKVFGSLRSNRTDDIVGFLKNEGTDLLAGGREELAELMGQANQSWSRIAPYAAFSQVVDQVVVAMVSQAALAGAFSRIASATKIPALFNAARGATVGMSTAGRLAVLAGINAGEAGLGMLTGAAMGKVGELVFGEKTMGAKIFGMVGGGLQLSVGSKVAMQSGLAFQAGLGITLGGAPILAEQLGMDPKLAEKLGTAAGIFIPTVLGTVGNHSTVRRAEGVMAELGVDPVKARGVMGEVFAAEAKGGAFDLEGFVRERAGKLVDQRFPELPGQARTVLADNLTLDAVRKKVELEVAPHASVGQHVRAVEGYYAKLESELVKAGIPQERAHTLAQGEKTAMYDEALGRFNEMMHGDGEGAPPADPRIDGGAGAATRQAVDDAARGAAEPLPEVQVLRSERGRDGKVTQKSEDGLQLVSIDRSSNSATVRRADGTLLEVPANNVVYLHDKRGLGLLTPAAKLQFDKRIHGMSEPQRVQWSEMLGAAHQRSPEHVQMLRKLLAGGASLEDIKAFHDWAAKIPQAELGALLSPGNLPQHLAKSCAAASAQMIDAILNPQAGRKLRDPGAQAQGQVQIMERNNRGWEARKDSRYPAREMPPLPSDAFSPAKPLSNKTPEMDAALTLAGHSDYEAHMAGGLDRRHLAGQLVDAAIEGPVFLQARRADGSDVVFEVTGVTRHPSGAAELTVRNTDGSGGELRWPAESLNPGSDGAIHVDGAVLELVALAPGRQLKRADNGITLERDPEIQNMVRAATGKELVRHPAEGTAALEAIHRSVQDVGFAGAVVGWRGETATAKRDGVDVQREPTHQLVVTGSKKNGDQYSFDVYDPTTGGTRTLTGDQLLQYHDGVSFDATGKPVPGALRFVQVPDDVPVGTWPTAPEPTRSGVEASAREHIVNHEPHKVATLRAIDRLPDGDQRRVATLALRGETNLDRLAYLEDAVKGGADPTARALADLADPSFTPNGRTAQDPELQRLAAATTNEQVAAALGDLTSFKELDADTQREVAGLFAANPTTEGRRALLELLPTLAELPSGALDHALERLAGMQPADLAKVAQRHKNLEPPSFKIATAADALRYATQVFGADPAPLPGTARAAEGSPGVRAGGKVLKGNAATVVTPYRGHGIR